MKRYALLLLLLPGCLAHELREPTERMCAAAKAAAARCRASELCARMTFVDEQGRIWPVLMDLEFAANEACALEDAVKAEVAANDD